MYIKPENDIFKTEDLKLNEIKDYLNFFANNKEINFEKILDAQNDNFGEVLLFISKNYKEKIQDKSFLVKKIISNLEKYNKNYNKFDKNQIIHQLIHSIYILVDSHSPLKLRTLFYKNVHKIFFMKIFILTVDLIHILL